MATLEGTAALPVVSAFAAEDALDPAAVEEAAILELEIALARHGGLLQGLARLSLLSGFLGATIEVMWLFAGQRGLDGLVRGLAERLAIERGAFSITLGVSTVLVLGYANRMAVLETRRLRREGGRLALELRQSMENARPTAPAQRMIPSSTD